MELWAHTMQLGWSRGLPAIPVHCRQISSSNWTCAFALQNATSQLAPVVTLTCGNVKSPEVCKPDPSAAFWGSLLECGFSECCFIMKSQPMGRCVGKAFLAGRGPRCLLGWAMALFSLFPSKFTLQTPLMLVWPPPISPHCFFL